MAEHPGEDRPERTAPVLEGVVNNCLAAPGDGVTQLEVLQSPVKILADRGELFSVKHHPDCEGEQVTIVVTGCCRSLELSSWL